MVNYKSKIAFCLFAAIIGLQYGFGQAASKSVKTSGAGSKQADKSIGVKKLMSKPTRARSQLVTPPGVPVPYPNTGSTIKHNKKRN